MHHYKQQPPSFQEELRRDTIRLKNKTVKNVRGFLHDIGKKLMPDQISVGEGTFEDQVAFNLNCQIFNQRLQFKPFVIVFCEYPSDVALTFKLAKRHNLPVKIRAGGHDHEGECTGTNVILIDVTRMNGIEVNRDGLARIGPGNRFIRLTTELAKLNVMIPHGTCATVGISGFTMGGGWGPWTRKYGMACERLVGADVVLGNAKPVSVDFEAGKPIPELLWALRGGGGMSYGLVTELRYQTFPLPKILIKFELQWNLYDKHHPDQIVESYPTLKVLKAWEEAILADDTENLIGTNLKINARPAAGIDFDPDTIAHNCTMYGYWEGNILGLVSFVRKYFEGVMPNAYKVLGKGGTDTQQLPSLSEVDLTTIQTKLESIVGDSLASLPQVALHNYGDDLMSSWDRESVSAIHLEMGKSYQGKPIPPDLDLPAPHKITSRLVDHDGLGANGKPGYAELLQSLTSSLVLEGNRERGLFTYVTLGAIAGPYYQQHKGENSAFPYADKQYTIQYQTWWNTEEHEKMLGQDNSVYDRTNRALDWIEASREAEISNTSGAFISFKDASVPTETYFAQNYERLKSIKKEYSKDPLNHFRSRKTIL